MFLPPQTTRTTAELVPWANCPDGLPLRTFAAELRALGHTLGEVDREHRRIELVLVGDPRHPDTPRR